MRIQPTALAIEAMKDEGVRDVMPVKLQMRDGREQVIELAQWSHKNERSRTAANLVTNMRVYERFICPGDLALDIGAQFGDTTLPMAALVGKTGKVMAFEPGPPWPILQWNAKINPELNIQLLNWAVTDQDRDWYYGSASGGNNGGEYGEGTKGVGLQKLTGKNLPNFLDGQVEAGKMAKSEIQSLNFIKTDVEGHDSGVIKSLMPLLKMLNASKTRNGRHTVLWVEWADWFDRMTFENVGGPDDCSDGSKAIFEAAEAAGYEPFGFDKSSVTPWRETPLTWPTDMVFGTTSSKADSVGFVPIPSCANKHKREDLLLLPKGLGKDYRATCAGAR